ncbi:MAG: replicative DNA helicase [Planctomycetes bacterium]|nr:replicative DNA helicase [Planctomycetota bacterium]
MAQSQEGADRLPPHNRDAERSVLGAMLRDNKIIPDVINVLGGRYEDFYVFAHQKIYESITGLFDKHKAADPVTLANDLNEKQLIQDIGGYGYLVELWEAAPSAANAVHYAEIVRQKAIVRNLIHACNELQRDAYDQVMPANELLDSAERRVLEIAELGVTGTTTTLQDAIFEAYDRINTRKGDHQDYSGVPSGFIDLDSLTAGMQDSELVIIAARPSVGKTSFALNILRHVVVEEKMPAFFVSLEQSRIEIAERLLCSQARVDSHRLRKGTLSSDEMAQLMEGGQTLTQAPLFIDDIPGQNMLRIAANARRLKVRHQIRIVVIDYLQLIDPDNRKDSRQEQVAAISRRLKFLARELKIPVLALAQVNRSSEDRQDHRPRLSDLRESGAIEQDADTVMLLHRPELHEPGQQEGVVEVIVGKQRNGPTGEVSLMYIKQFMRFENFAVDHSTSFI